MTYLRFYCIISILCFFSLYFLLVLYFQSSILLIVLLRLRQSLLRSITIDLSKKIAMSMSIRCHDRDCTSSCRNQACGSVVFVCSRMPANSKRRLVLGRPPVRPSVFWLLTGPRESPPWGGGGVMGERRAETGGRRAHTHVCPSLHLPHTPHHAPYVSR